MKYYIIVFLILLCPFMYSADEKTGGGIASTILLRGIPQGGRITIGSLGNTDQSCFITTKPGMNLDNVIDAFVNIKQQDEESAINGFKKIDNAVPGILGVYAPKSYIFVRSTDPGIVPAKSVSKLCALSVNASNEVRLNWTLPDGAPESLRIFRGLKLLATIDGKLTSFIDHISAEEVLDMFLYYTVISYDTSPNGHTIPGDYRKIMSMLPSKMKSDIFSIIRMTNATPFLGQPYEEYYINNSGLNPVSWESTGGELPNGLTLTDEGELSGTPTVPGVFSFTITATDSAGAVVSKEFTLKISK